jgi:exosortase F-associated protein
VKRFNKKYILIAVLMILLILIRFYEKQFFDDGLIVFFQFDYGKKPLPQVSLSHILLVVSLRYGLNSLISIAVLHLLFSQKYLIRFLIIFYGIIYIILIVSMWILINTYQAGEYLPLFYTRRFLIQPVLLFILIPALLYQKRLSSRM